MLDEPLYNRLCKVPEFMAIVRLRTRLRARRYGRPGKRTAEELETQLLEAKRLYNDWKLQNPEAFKKRGKKPKSEEDRARGWAIHEHNQWIHTQKKEARRERDEFMEQWRKRWAHVYKPKSQKGRRHRKKRDQLMKETRTPNDKALLGQINNIMFGACACYWCGVALPSGGTVDHIVALTKGGAHSSANICAACSSCNSAKSDRTPQEAGMSPTLF